MATYDDQDDFLTQEQYEAATGRRQSMSAGGSAVAVGPLRRDNKVLPGLQDEQQPVRRYQAAAEILPAELPMMAPAATSSVRLHTTYRDRAAGFQAAISPLAAGLALCTFAIVVVGFSVPIVSLAAAFALFGTFALTWLVGWTVHMVISPDFAPLLHAWLGWRYIYREQAERHRRYREDGEQ